MKVTGIGLLFFGHMGVVISVLALYYARWNSIEGLPQIGFGVIFGLLCLCLIIVGLVLFIVGIKRGKRSISKPPDEYAELLGLIIGLLLFVSGLGMAVFLIIIRETTSAAVIGPASAIMTASGIIVSHMSCTNLNIRKIVGWFFLASGVFMVIYCLQWLIPELVERWDPITRGYGDLASAIVVVCLISFVIPGAIIFIGWRVSHPRKIVPHTLQPPDEPAEEP